MKKKIITIVVKEADLTLPKHLQQPPIVDFSVDGFSQLEAIQMIISLASNLFNQYKDEIDKATPLNMKIK